jgi:hypothetical protein
MFAEIFVKGFELEIRCTFRPALANFSNLFLKFYIIITLKWLPVTHPITFTKVQFLKLRTLYGFVGFGFIWHKSIFITSPVAFKIMFGL